MKLCNINICTKAMHKYYENGEGKPQYIDTLRVPPLISLYDILDTSYFPFQSILLCDIISKKEDYKDFKILPTGYARKHKPEEIILSRQS